MTWITPKTWTANELVTAAMLNTHLRDNLNALKAPPTQHYECDESANYTTTSGVFVDVDATNLALTIETTGGDLLVHFHGTISQTSTVAAVMFDLELDGARVAGNDGILVVQTNAQATPVSFTYLITGLSADEHTIALQWKTTTGSATMYAGAGTAYSDIHPQMWAREVS